MASVATIATPIGLPLRVGDREPTRVMALVGSTSRADERQEQNKIELIAKHINKPDIISDLSLRRANRPLWRRILEAGFPAATLPVYTTTPRERQLDARELLDRAIEQIEGGVGMITIHPTARNDIISSARRRNVPWTSRGGALIIADLLTRSVATNAYLQILPDLAPIAQKRGVTISIGATFRSATIMDADDPAQRKEIAFQRQLARELRNAGNSVIIEGPGHATPAAIRALAKRMREIGCPIMPLGPIPTDLAVGQDHISAAIGATLMGLEGAAHILAAVTREEHTGGVPSVSSTLEALDAARVATMVIDLHKFGAGRRDKDILTQRARYHTCVAGRVTAGCSRCGDACPLVV